MDKDKKVWKIVLENLKINLSPASFSTWFSQTFIVRIKEIDNGRQITEIGCPNSFIRDSIESRYYGLIKDALDKATAKKNDLLFLIKENKNQEKTIKKSDEPLFNQTNEETDLTDIIKKHGLRPDFTFDNFAVSSSNQMAHAASLAVASSPGKAYNPLFLYGGVGVGKTHLGQAIAIEILKRQPQTKIVYCMGEEFTNEIVEAIRKKTTNDFKNKYRSAKILLIDDIQFIAGKNTVQEEFFHTFNAVWRAGGQIILTSDRRPDEINKLEDRLRSRFEGGLTIDIQEPNFELRSAILLIKAQQLGIELPMDVATVIASNITSTRKLEGVLVRIINESKTKNEPITPDLANAVLGQNGTSTIPKKSVKPREFINAVAAYFEFKTNDLTGPRRAKQIVVPRQVLMYLLRTELKISLMEIGRLLGGRDHTTVMYGVEKITNNLSTTEGLRVDILGIKQRLYG